MNKSPKSSIGLAAALAVGLVITIAPGASAQDSKVAASSAQQGSTITAAPQSQYVQADSPAEAAAILDRLENSRAGALAPLGVRFGPCVLHPANIHPRKSSNRNAVGVKPYTKCSAQVSSIRHSTDLRYKKLLWWKKAGTYTGGNVREKSYTQRDIAYRCKGKAKTTWSGTTAGTIRYNGRTYYARVYQTPQKIACKA
ncbi:hypothetical protein [Arthrobacter rhombi]|uniref:hypothetical protein n=1 Tax=Arthrobacter rhombi TaxID=71253 RepID=UPI003FD572BD